MATVTPLLTLQEFHDQYDDRKPYFEFRRGQAIQKPMPTRIHNLLQRVLVAMLEANTGYVAELELELWVTDDWHPIPDVIANFEIEDPYPTKPVDVVIEVLSPTDRTSDTLVKCADYQGIGIKAIFVMDPIQRTAWRWLDGTLHAIDSLDLPNAASLSLAAVWEELDRQIHRRPSA